MGVVPLSQTLNYLSRDRRAFAARSVSQETSITRHITVKSVIFAVAFPLVFIFGIAASLILSRMVFWNSAYFDASARKLGMLVKY